MKYVLDNTENPLVLYKYKDMVVEQEEKIDWEIKKDRDGIYMIFYRGIPADEIIYAVGEVSLAMTTNITSLQKEYYDDGVGDVFNMAVKLIRDNKFAKTFYSSYTILREKL